ncbi:MAG TPA: ABC transporter substrate-binding protein [Acidimicrobiales bacterium]|nr:ABC transporter substrate-binding protein [Acidimicrobiales bacterium]
MSRRRPVKLSAVVAAVAAAALLLASCGNSKGNTGATGSQTQGVTNTEIDVGSIANVTGPLSADFAPIVNGVEAYFSMVNAAGGVSGRKLVLKYQTDDQGSATGDLSAAQTLVQKDHAFAVVGVGTPFFGGAKYLGQNNIPTFGYVVSSDWSPYKSLFGDYGSYLYFPGGGPGDGYIAQQLGAKSIAVVAYGVPQSAAACQAAVTALRGFGLNVSYTNLNFPFGSDPTADVLQMKSAGVDLLFACLDVTGNVAFARAIIQNGLTMNQVWFNGYDRGTLQQYSSIMQGVYFGVQHVPFEAALRFPGVYPGLDTYIREMEKYQPKYTYNETALDGWMAADQFVTGLKAVGHDVTQSKLVDAINKEKAYNGGGLTTPVDWTKAHTTPVPPFCQASVKVEGDSFVPSFIQGTNQVFTCFDAGSTTPVAPPPQTPGL